MGRKRNYLIEIKSSWLEKEDILKITYTQMERGKKR